MKYIVLSLMLFAGISSFAQEAGRAGELLKNEASKNETESSRLQKPNLRNNTSPNSGFRNPDAQNRRNPNPNYQWNRTFGYAEVFLRIPEQGNFSVELADQMMANTSGRFRFFDLPAGRIPISIYENGFLLYRSMVNVQNNSRMVLDFFTNKGLYLLDSYPVQRGYYGFNNWNDVWNNAYGKGNSSNGYYPDVMDNRTFQQFLSVMNKEAWFDDKKITFITQQSRHTMFTSEQIRVLVKELSFDRNRLALAKALFSKCVDKQNFFVVGDALDFDNSRRELMDFTSKN